MDTVGSHMAILTEGFTITPKKGSGTYYGPFGVWGARASESPKPGMNVHLMPSFFCEVSVRL